MIKRVNIPQHTQDWYDFRQNGYGASEIAGVLTQYISNLTDYIYTSPIQVHLDKVGEDITGFSGNVQSEAGHYMEKHIIDMYRFWDHSEPDQMLMFDNIKKGKKHNICRRASYFEINDKYPWLFFSPDGKEYVHVDGQLVPKGILECKNTTSMEANRYPNKVSPSFLAQVVMGLLISELEYARILIFIDGSWLEVVTIYAEDDWVQELKQTIIRHSAESWKKVLECRIVKEKYNIEYYYKYNVEDMTSQQQEGVALLQQMEPELVGTDTEHQWVKDNIIPRTDEVPMEITDDQWEMCVNRDKIKTEIKEGKLAMSLNKIEETLKLSLVQSGCNVATHEDKLAFSYKKDKKGTARLYVNPKMFKEV